MRKYNILITFSVFLAIMVNIAYAETGLVAQWRFDENSGATAGDSAGNGLSGSIAGATWVIGKSGNALNFSNVNDYVLISDNDKMTFSNGNFTVEAWFKLSQNHQAGSSNKWILLKNGEYGLYLNGGNGNLQFYFSDSYQSSAKNTWDANTWYHVAGVHSSDGSWKIYVNGVVDASGSKSYFTTRTDCSFDIGNFLGCSYAHDNFVGAIDEVKTYSRSLTANEILTEYQSPANTTQPADTTSPTVSISHSPSSSTTNDKVNITATASDNVGVSSVNIYVGNSNVKTCNSSPCDYSAFYSVGSWTYYATVSDTSGNTARDPVSGTKSFVVSLPVNQTNQTNQTTVNATTCPVCSAPSLWSSCSNNIQTRANYKCDATTNYQCQSYVEMQSCAVANVTINQTNATQPVNLTCSLDSECAGKIVCPQVIGSDTPRCISNACQCGAKLVDKTVLLGILIQLETLKTSFVSLNNSATSLLNYYTSVNDTFNIGKWTNVTILFGDGVNSITDIQNYVNTVKDAPTEVDIQNVKTKVGNVLVVIDKIIKVILNG